MKQSAAPSPAPKAIDGSHCVAADALRARVGGDDEVEEDDDEDLAA